MLRLNLKIVLVIFGFVFANLLSTRAFFSSSSEVKGMSFSTGTWANSELETQIVVNEVMFNPNSLQGGANAEWIELYNKSASAINLDNWTLWDNGAGLTISGDYFIPSGGFAIISSRDLSANWSFPAEAVKIITGGTKLFSYGLSNEGDRVVLFNPSSEQIDAVSWGTDRWVFDDPKPGADSGESISRSFNGKDTNSASDFITLINPTPGS